MCTQPVPKWWNLIDTNALRPYLGKSGLEFARLEIEPPQGTVDDHGRKVRTLIAVVKLRGA